jgi:hypothetical protein
MRFSLACTTKVGNVFGGKKIRSTLEGKLTVATDYSMIYVTLAGKDKDGKGNFDVIEGLNEAFSLNLNFNLLVKSAGFFQLRNSKPNNKVALESLENNFPIIPFPKSTEQFNKVLGSFTCFWAEIEFSSWSIGESLVDIGSGQGKTGYLNLYGFFEKSSDIKATSIYYAELPDFTLFKFFSFQNLTVEYTFQNSTEYVISGKISVQNFTDPDKQYYFTGKLDKKGSNVSGVLKSEGQIDLNLPFHMPGIVFSNLKFAAWHSQDNDTSVKPKSLYWLQGDVTYGALSLTGQIYLLGKTPVLVKVELLNPLSIETLFEQSIPGFQWPGEFINITFKAGSTLYYYRKEESSDSLLKSSFFVVRPDENNEDKIVPVEDSNIYREGFNIYAEIDLTLLTTISLSGNFRIISEENSNNQSNGVTASIQLENPIDIYVLQISAPKEGGNGGPIFEVSTIEQDRYARLKCGLKFFKTDFGLDAIITVKKDSKDPNESTLIEGTLATQEHFAVFNNSPASLDFSYSKFSGFEVKNWPKFTLEENIIDFVKTLQQLASEVDNPICGKLTDFVTNQAYLTKFTISPSFTTKPDGLYFVLAGKYTLSVLTHEFLTADFPNALEFLLPNNLSFKALPDQIANSIARASPLFVQTLLNNPEAISKFLVIIGGKQAIKYANDLLCNGLADPAVVSAADVGSAALDIAGGVAAGATAIGAVGKAIANALSGGGGGGTPKDSKPAAPSKVTLLYENNSIVASWSEATYASGYQVTFVDASGIQLKKESLLYTQRTTSLSFTEFMTAVTVKVASTREAYSSSEAVATIDRWQAPTDLQLSVLKDSQKIRAVWTGNALNYVLRLMPLMPNSSKIASQEAPNSPVEFDATSLSPGEYQAIISATGGSSNLPSLPSPPSNTVYLLAPPKDVHLTFDPVTRTPNVSWMLVESAVGYWVRVLNENGNSEVFTTSVMATIQELPVFLDRFFAGDDPGIYYAQVVALGNDVSFDSPIARSIDTVIRLGDIQGLRQSANKARQQLVVTWERLEGATQYEVLLLDQSEGTLMSTVVDQPISATEAPVLEIDLASYLRPQGLTLQAGVSLKGTSNILPGKSRAMSDLVIQIAAPTNLQMDWSQQTGEINITWQGNEQVLQYQIEIWEVATQSVVVARTVGAIPLNLTIRESEFSSSPNGVYQLKIQALANENYFDSTVVQGPQIEISKGSGLPFPYLKFDEGGVTSIDIGTYSYEEFKGGQNAPNCLVNLNQGFAASVWVLPKDTGTSLPIMALRALDQRKDYMLPDSDSVMVLSIEIMDSSLTDSNEDGQPISTASRTGHLVLRAVRPNSWNSGVPGPPQQMELVGTLPIPYDQWTLVTLAEPYGGGTCFFVNGQLDKQVQWNAWAAFFNFFTFGQHGNQSFAGNMAHISLWRIPLYEVPDIVVQIPPVGLSSSEIAEREPLGLGGYWPLDETQRETIYDLTSTRHNGRILRALISELETISIGDFNWQVTGPGTTSIELSNNNSITFNYRLEGESVWQTQTWIFFATAARTGVVKFNWNYSGFHGWYQVQAEINAFSKGLPEQNQNFSFSVGGSMQGEGQALIKINQGYEFGFVIKGRNFDRDTRLLGSLTITIDLL